MAQVGQIAASSSGVVNLDFIPERLMVNNVAPVSGTQITSMTVVTAGKTNVQITGNTYINAVAAFDMQSAGRNVAAGDERSEPAKWIKLAVGRINKQTNITLANGSGSIFPVLAASTQKGTGIVRTIGEQVLNQASNATFGDFEMLVVQSNLLRASVVFDDGFKDDYEPAELQALWASEQNAGLDGLVEGHICISGRNVESVTVYAATGASTKIVKTSYEQL